VQTVGIASPDPRTSDPPAPLSPTRPARSTSEPSEPARLSPTRPEPPARRAVFSALAAPGFGLLWASGALWHISRWGIAFLSAYLVNDLTDSPRLVQLTGAVMWTPLLLGGVLGGVIADRFDRRRTVLLQMAVLTPLVAVIAVLVQRDTIEVWMLYPFLFVVGIGWVFDMTSRRSLVFDVVGSAQIDNAMALESLSLSGGIALGTLLGGSVISLLGIGAAFGVVAALLCIAGLLLWRVQPPPATVSAGTSTPIADLRDGLGLLRTHRGLVGILGVTVVANFFYFAYFPLVQVIADDLDVGAFLTGLLASATGLGMMAGSLLVARFQPRRRGLVYLTGVFTGMALLIGFATLQWYPAALGFLLGSSIGGGLFGSTQSTLVMTTVEAAVRGRALGLLSMAIGALPVGMFLLGELAEVVGTGAAITVFSVSGSLLLALWQSRHREVAAMEAEPAPS
jgi:predicted MFS family arabinose efflux permease